MRMEIQWLVVIICGLAAQPVIAADLREIQVWLSSGGSRPIAFAALADGTLAIVKLNDAFKPEQQRCALATRQEVELLSRLVDQIPATAPWGRQWVLPDDCSDETEATLHVTAGKGELDVHYSLTCQPAGVPAWVTALTAAMSDIQEKYVACSTSEN